MTKIIMIMIPFSVKVEPKLLSADPPLKGPPMGFNSWNYYHCNIDENIIKVLKA